MRFWLFFLLFLLTILSALLWTSYQHIEERYQALLSVTIYDRNDVPLKIYENTKGHYVSATESLPKDFVPLLLAKEDAFFYYHPGINPISTARALYHYLVSGRTGGASTITQQLAKNLLESELERTIANKIREAWYSIALELFHTKEEILLMYANTVYLGNQVQGFETASHAYFDKPLANTTHNERISLLATLSYPNARNPWEVDNQMYAENLQRRLMPNERFIMPPVTPRYSFQRAAFFELQSAGITCTHTCHTSIDDELTEKSRAILARHVARERERGARNGAIVIIDPKTGELLTLIGTKDPGSTADGDQINMALAPRPIGSTIKPLIYLKGFVDGLRPYSQVEDREYKYSIATGFPLYPKNYDGQYRGTVTLHESLSNSLNVPTVKVLEYIGLPAFYAFMSDKLQFTPLRDYDSYQYGIALGGLEMDLLTLTHYFTIFPQGGTLKPLRVLQMSNENFSLPPQSTITKPVAVAEKKYVELIHAILSDRLSGVDQFGLESTLNIETTDYGVKTGTSRDFHDSWVVGYTGDFVVGVWIGNTENEPLKQVTGQSGAGAVWHDVMNLLLESQYSQNTTLTKTEVQLLPFKHSGEWGLQGDVVSNHRTLLLGDNLILSPYDNDSFEFFSGLSIPLTGRRELTWTVNGIPLGSGKAVTFHPTKTGLHEIVALDPNTGDREIIQINVVNPQ